ncbi:portal protein [Brevundimonas phage vB_BpoS-Bambus]|nr:portal protein [Brevundimonas phage vB_BpoS-Bambus]
MAGTAPNSTNISRTKRAVQAFSHVVHPEYEYWRPEWSKIRDAIAGEREIKKKGAEYLRPMTGSDGAQYEEYLHRAVFYNMTNQTLAGMVGQVFRRPPQVRGLPRPGAVIARGSDGEEIVVNAGQDIAPSLYRFAKDGSSHSTFAKTIATEQLALGRFGVLVDAAKSTPGAKPQAFAVGYAAENILDWQIEDVDGFYVPTRILLREFVREQASGSHDNRWIDEPNRRGRRTRPQTAMVRTADGTITPAAGKSRQAMPDATVAGGYHYTTLYRELVLEFQDDGSRVYVQRVYREDPTGIPEEVLTPLIRGNPLRFIPFVFFGAFSNAADCEKPPILDIVDLNLKHYRTYAELEYGRFYTALPTYYAPGNADNDAAEYHIGPGTVWEVPSGEQPGILEFKGEGLKTLERALNEKEQQIAAIGGRMMPGASKSTSESNQQSAMREANEQSLLLNVITALEEGMTQVVRFWLMFRDVLLSDTAKVRYEIDTTFLSTALDARAIRAVQQLVEAGLLTSEHVYEVWIKYGLIPSSETLDEFTTKMKDANSFVGQPDAEAMRRGYVSRAQELEQARIAREADFQQQEIDLQERARALEEEKLAFAQQYGATSVSASRELGDIEQAPPSQKAQRQLDIQAKQADAAIRAAANKATAPAPTPRRPGSAT